MNQLKCILLRNCPILPFVYFHGTIESRLSLLFRTGRRNLTSPPPHPTLTYAKSFQCRNQTQSVPARHRWACLSIINEWWLVIKKNISRSVACWRPRSYSLFSGNSHSFFCSFSRLRLRSGCCQTGLYRRSKQEHTTSNKRRIMTPKQATARVRPFSGLIWVI